MILRIFLILTVITTFSVSSFANRKLAEQYIQQYKDIAIEEMYRTGIPASIKLAQGLLESSWGQSDLASEANNHFGIKCGGQWEGRRFFKVDDDKDQMGNPVESCFRSFADARESYIAHSEFLTNPAKTARYGFLFQYPTTDYISWAKGLQFSGYATDQKYADKLIQLIETYRLAQYDVLLKPVQSTEPVFVKNNTYKQESNSPETKSDQPVLVHKDVLQNQSSSEKTKPTKTNRKYINGLLCAVATEGETIESLAKKHRTDKHDIVIYNESKYYLDTPLKEGDIIFLESKKRFNDQFQFHIVKDGENLFSIAQKYGIKSGSLASRNKIPEHASLSKGLKLHINQPGTDYSHLREELVTEEYIDFGNIK